MKRIIEILTLMIFAFTHNVEYHAPVEQQFTTFNYYKGNVLEGDVDYKDLYTRYNANVDDLEKCLDESFLPANQDFHTVGTTNLIWLIPGEDPGNYEPTFTDGQEIVAPAQCTILSDSGAGRNSTELSVSLRSGAFKLTFSNLRCWFCCAKKTPPSDGVYIHTGENKKGSEIQQKQVLAIATADTTVTAYKANSKGKWKKCKLEKVFK